MYSRRHSLRKDTTIISESPTKTALTGRDTVAFAQAAVAILSQYFVVTTKGDIYVILDRDTKLVESVTDAGKPDLLLIGRRLKTHLLTFGVAPNHTLVAKMVDFFRFNADPDWIVPTSSADTALSDHEWRIDLFSPRRLNAPNGTPPSQIVLADERQEALFS